MYDPHSDYNAGPRGIVLAMPTSRDAETGIDPPDDSKTPDAHEAAKAAAVVSLSFSAFPWILVPFHVLYPIGLWLMHKLDRPDDQSTGGSVWEPVAPLSGPPSAVPLNPRFCSGHKSAVESLLMILARTQARLILFTFCLTLSAGARAQDQGNESERGFDRASLICFPDTMTL